MWIIQIWVHLRCLGGIYMIKVHKPIAPVNNFLVEFNELWRCFSNDKLFLLSLDLSFDFVVFIFLYIKITINDLYTCIKNSSNVSLNWNYVYPNDCAWSVRHDIGKGGMSLCIFWKKNNYFTGHIFKNSLD